MDVPKKVDLRRVTMTVWYVVIRHALCSTVEELHANISRVRVDQKAKQTCKNRIPKLNTSLAVVGLTTVATVGISMGVSSGAE